jgi:protein-tyrosine phosphatase
MPRVTEILLVCTANVCRSPMAESLLARELAVRGVAATVRSAGTGGCGAASPAEVVTVMAGHGLDVTGHRGRLVTAADLAGADLVLALAREHLRHAVVAAPEAWPRAFTVREAVRRGRAVGGRAPGEPLAAWLGRLHAGRSRLALLGDSAQDDVADPMGGPLSDFAATAAGLAWLTAELADLGWHPRPQ